MQTRPWERIYDLADLIRKSAARIYQNPENYDISIVTAMTAEDAIERIANEFFEIEEAGRK